MTTQTEALKLAHEELKHIKTWCLRSIGIGLVNENVLAKIEEALAQPEQEPVAITITGKLGNIYSFTGDYSLKKGDKVYTTPPQRTWVNATTWRGLTDEEIERDYYGRHDFVRAVELRIKEKNT